LEKNGDGLFMIYTAEDLVIYRDILENEMKEFIKKDSRFQMGEATSGAILMADIDMSSVCGPDKGNWRPIGYGVNEEFPDIPGASLVTFDGNGHSISGLYMKTEETGGGLFVLLQNAVVTNLTIKNSTLDCTYGAGGTNRSNNYGTGTLAMRTDGTTIKNCTVEADVTVSGSYTAGGFVGLASEGGNLFERCVNKGTITAHKGAAGGIAGQSSRTTDVFYCDNYGTINGDNGARAGGILGRATGSSHYDGNIMGCVNYGTIVNVQQGPNYIAGIIGDNNSTIYCCINAGDIQANGGRGYDIASDSDGTFRECINIGKIYNADNEDKYAYLTGKKDRGVNTTPDDPGLTDGTLIAGDKLDSYYWVQGEKFPEWNGMMP
jgi:hypothetical protein